MAFTPQAHRYLALLILMVMVVCGLQAAPAFAYTPDSPEVRAVVAKALRFLESDLPRRDDRIGALSVIGLACYKASDNKNHPRVREAVAACQQAMQRGYNQNESTLHYNIGLGIIFLTEIDPVKYRNEIDYYHNLQQKMQKGHGGYGYPGGHQGRDTGDTSQVQYAVLANWCAKKLVKREVETGSLENITGWLMRTQDPSGGWGYQGEDPGPGGSLRQQAGVSLSLSAAGLGSLYACADTLGFGDAAKEEAAEANKSDSEGLAPELTRVDNRAKKRRAGPITDKISAAALNSTLGRGDGWFAKNYDIKSARWQFYYLYALERMHSFRDRYRGIDEKEPKWYNEGVRLLTSTQEAEGNWKYVGSSAVGDHVATSFAVLFLLRSTQRTLQAQEIGEGLAIGGRDFATNTGKLKKGAGGKLESLQVDRSVAEVLEILENPNHPEFESLASQPENLALGTEIGARTSHAERLRAIVSRGDYRARQVAVRNLARSGNLDNVPIIIFALSDPDWRVVKEARDGLRFISRKFAGFGLPLEANEVQKREAQQKWGAWFKSIRPDGELLSDYSGG